MSAAPIAIASGLLAAGVGAGVYLLLRRGGVAIGPLSERRKFVLAAVAAVVPSQYGDAKFAEIAPGYNPDDPALPKGFTTCGYLPCYVGRKLQAPKCITQGGLEQMRTNGRAMGAWVDNDGSRLPRPGDLYAIGSDRLIVHVGVVIDAGPREWTTADAGQGTIGAGQRAAYVTRPYDWNTRTSGGIGTTLVSGKGWTLRGDPRTVAGWIDIDKVPGATP